MPTGRLIARACARVCGCVSRPALRYRCVLRRAHSRTAAFCNEGFRLRKRRFLTGSIPHLAGDLKIRNSAKSRRSQTRSVRFDRRGSRERAIRGSVRDFARRIRYVRTRHRIAIRWLHLRALSSSEALDNSSNRCRDPIPCQLRLQLLGRMSHRTIMRETRTRFSSTEELPLLGNDFKEAEESWESTRERPRRMIRCEFRQRAVKHACILLPHNFLFRINVTCD